MSFFFFYQGYDSHDAPDVAAKKRERKVKEEEQLLRYLLRHQEKKPKLVRKIDKDSLRETLLKNFKGEEVKELLAVVAAPEVISAKDLVRAYQEHLINQNLKKIKLLMTLIMMDEDEYNEH